MDGHATLPQGSNVTVRATTNSSTRLTWSATPGADGYRIERSTNNGAFVQVATVPGGTSTGR